MESFRCKNFRNFKKFTITDSEPDGGILYPVRTFADDMKRLLVVKRPGMEKFSLLDKDADGEADDLSSSLWGSVFSKKSTTKGGDDEDDDGKIHVFSLATGHMYERLLRIMMLSVSKRTSKPVLVFQGDGRFWLGIIGPRLSRSHPHRQRAISHLYRCYAKG